MAAGSLHLAEMISAPTVRLTAAGAITQDPSASIVATTLQADSGAGQTLIGDNQVGRYFAFNASGDIEFVNAGELRIQGIQQSGGSVSITSGGSIYFDGLAKLDAGGERGNLTLVAGRHARSRASPDRGCERPSHRDSGRHLAGRSAGHHQHLGRQQRRWGLVAISTTANGPAIGDVEQVDGGDIQITGTGPLVLSGVIRTVDGVSIMASGDVAQAGSSRIVAGQLVTQSAGGLHLDGANEIGVLTVTNNGGAVVVNNVGTLQVAGISQLSGGDVSLTAQGGIILRVRWRRRRRLLSRLPEPLRRRATGALRREVSRPKASAG